MTKSKGFLDSLLDVTEGIVDGATRALDGVRTPGDDDEQHPESWLDCPDCRERSKAGAKPPRCERYVDRRKPQSVVPQEPAERLVIIDIPPETTAPLLKSGTTPRKARELPREVSLQIRNISKRSDGKYQLIAEMETHEVVAVVLSEEDWNKIVDTAAWLE